MERAPSPNTSIRLSPPNYLLLPMGIAGSLEFICCQRSLNDVKIAILTTKNAFTKRYIPKVSQFYGVGANACIMLLSLKSPLWVIILWHGKYLNPCHSRRGEESSKGGIVANNFLKGFYQEVIGEDGWHSLYISYLFQIHISPPWTRKYNVTSSSQVQKIVPMNHTYRRKGMIILYFLCDWLLNASITQLSIENRRSKIKNQFHSLLTKEVIQSSDDYSL